MGKLLGVESEEDGINIREYGEENKEQGIGIGI